MNSSFIPSVTISKKRSNLIAMVIIVLGIFLVLWLDTSEWVYRYLHLDEGERSELREVIIPFDMAVGEGGNAPNEYRAVNGLGELQDSMKEAAEYYFIGAVDGEMIKRESVDISKRTPFMPTQEGYDSSPAWSYDGQYAALIYQSSVRVFKGEQAIAKIDRSDLSDLSPIDLAWVLGEEKLVILTDSYVRDHFPKSSWVLGTSFNKLFVFDVEMGEMNEICEDRFNHYFVEVEHGYPPPLTLSCLDTPKARAMFGSPEHPTRRLIMYSPSKRFYFYQVFQEGLYMNHVWIEGYDTVKKRSWKVIDTFPG